MTDAISGTRRQYRELADGTIRVQVDIDPRFKDDFHKLFPRIDSPVALAPLAGDFERREPKRLGPAAQWLGARCREPVFREFLNMVYRVPVNSEADAAQVVRTICKVTSRADIDGNAEAEELFEGIRRGYLASQRHKGD